MKVLWNIHFIVGVQVKETFVFNDCPCLHWEVHLQYHCVDIQWLLFLWPFSCAIFRSASTLLSVSILHDTTFCSFLDLTIRFWIESLCFYCALNGLHLLPDAIWKYGRSSSGFNLNWGLKSRSPPPNQSYADIQNFPWAHTVCQEEKYTLWSGEKKSYLPSKLSLWGIYIWQEWWELLI